MNTTRSGIYHKASLAGLSLAIALQGCVSTTQFARPGADAQQVEADKRACAQAGPVVAGMIGGGAMGAVAGAGASATGENDGVAVALGLLVGLAAGLTTAILADDNGADYDRCMEGKGYHAI